ncbi:hypothetical protein T12_4956 [Trichinella patagoniensis]|uniref:Uncharacterized protein n=1 Tax=Trichinella patagoniensis TaxID=990121 RepID=A0A0V0ZD93_9BILA|nr:hypothetical protein T12_4956 [Trichinella patagoniensis]
MFTTERFQLGQMMHGPNMTERVLLNFQCGHDWVAPAFKIWQHRISARCLYTLHLLIAVCIGSLSSFQVMQNCVLALLSALCCIIGTELTVVVLGRPDKF